MEGNAHNAYCRREHDRMRAMSHEEMARRQEESARGQQNANLCGDHMRGQAAMSNFYLDAVYSLQVARSGQITKKLTPFQRIARWFKKELDKS